MDSIHKLITYLVSPLTVGVVLMLTGLALGLRLQKVGKQGLTFFANFAPTCLALSLIWLWVWSTPYMSGLLGLSLEEKYPPIAAEQLPTADVICLLGGGMGINTNACLYPEMWSNADRVWHAVRLWKAGKAPLIFLSGGDVRKTTVPLLVDFGVPTNALIFVEEAKNTEEEARFIAREVASGQEKVVSGQRLVASKGNKELSPSLITNHKSLITKPRVLLVTSAWHMRRAELLFRRSGLDVIPAATDYEATTRYHGMRLSLGTLVPHVENLGMNAFLFKEHFAYWCYRVKWLVARS